MGHVTSATISTMRLRARVGNTTGAATHRLAHLDGGELIKGEALPRPAWVEIERQDHGYYLFSLDASRKCFADTWHPTLEAAKAQARFEFGIPEEDWEAVAD